MPIDGDLERDHRPRRGVADFRTSPAIHHTGRQMKQQVDKPWGLIAPEQKTQQLVLLRSDAAHAATVKGRANEQLRGGRSGFDEVAHGFVRAVARWIRVRGEQVRVMTRARASSSGSGFVLGQAASAR